LDSVNGAMHANRALDMAAGRLPITLIQYEITGEADEAALFWEAQPIPSAD